MNDYLAKPIEEEKLFNLLQRYKPGTSVLTRQSGAEPIEPAFNPNATLDWQLALRQAAGKPDLARDMLQMLIDFLPEVRNKIEEQLVGENPQGLIDLIHKLHGSCGYSGVPRMKNLCQLLESQLRQKRIWNPNFWNCWTRWITWRVKRGNGCYRPDRHRAIRPAARLSVASAPF